MSDFSSQSQAYAAALQRAKQIAAKIQPNQVPQMGPGSVGGGGGGGGGNGGGVGGGGGGGGGGGYKRTHDDSDSGPDSKRFTSPGSDYGSHNNSNMSSGSTGGGGGGGGGGGVGNGAPNLSQARAQAAAVAARLAAAASTTCEEQIRIPESIVNAFVGRSGNDTISHIQAESGCKVQLSQDNEQVYTLRGSRETVTKGREMIQLMANRNGGGTVEVILTINMPPPGASGCPQFQELMIPGTKVGLVIGKGGDTIKQLQEKTGAKMVIIQDGPNQEVIKPLRITGDPQKIEHAKQLVLELIAQKDAQAQQQGSRNNASMGGTNNGSGFNSFGEQCEVFVPKIAVGVVIGKGGDMIRKIQTECGCKLQFIPGKNDEPGDRRCVIQGTRQQVEDAKRMIDGLIENVMQRNQGNNNRNANGNNGSMDNGNSNYGYGYGVNHAQQPPREEITFMIPASKCGIVIGRGGETIKLINQQSGAYCEMDRNAVNPPAEKLFKCKGTSEQVEAARQMIAEKINMDIQVISRKPINGSGPLNNQQAQQTNYPSAMQADPNAAYQQQWAATYAQQGWGDPQQQQMVGAAGMGQAAAAAGGQQADYSAQWIEYYKSVGMHREAEMVEQQMKAKQVAAATGTAGQPMGMSMQPQQQQQQQQQPQQQQAQAAGGQTDYSAQWAEYYRSVGKIEEAEAIEKQMKQNQNAQANNSVANANSHNNSNSNNGNAGSNAGGGGGAASAGSGVAGSMQQPQTGYPQGVTASPYAQYTQYYAAAAATAAGGGGAPGGYPQQTYGGYGAPYPGAPQPGVMPGGGGGGNSGSSGSVGGGGSNNTGGSNSNSHQKQKNDKN